MPASETRRAHLARDLERLFERTFMREQNTLLLHHEDAWRGAHRLENASEPVYLPAGAHCPYNRIVYAHGFFASAMHELAHWCVAGASRRQRVDYGYWYEPDGRNAEQQAEFERVETRPQAVEWALSIAAGFPFQVSADNLSGVAVDHTAFTRRVHAHLVEMIQGRTLPPRARRLARALSDFYQTSFALPGYAA